MKKILAVLLAVCLVVLSMSLPVYAVETPNNVMPTAQDNLRIGLRSNFRACGNKRRLYESTL